MFLDHPFDRLAVHACLSSCAAHMSVVAREKVQEKRPLEGFDRLLLGQFE